MTADLPARVLTVCTHNRTRSVMMAGLLASMLDDRLGAGAVELASSGFRTEGLPAIDDAVAAMNRRGIDVSEHRSRVTTVELIDAADLIVTAERDHVVRIAALSPAAFRSAMTLPELLQRAAASESGAAHATDLRSWSAALTADRTAGGYLRSPVPEVADPTGTRPRAFEQAVADLERQCAELAVAIADLVRP